MERARRGTVGVKQGGHTVLTYSQNLPVRLFIMSSLLLLLYRFGSADCRVEEGFFIFTNVLFKILLLILVFTNT